MKIASHEESETVEGRSKSRMEKGLIKWKVTSVRILFLVYYYYYCCCCCCCCYHYYYYYHYGHYVKKDGRIGARSTQGRQI